MFDLLSCESYVLARDSFGSNHKGSRICHMSPHPLQEDLVVYSRQNVLGGMAKVGQSCPQPSVPDHEEAMLGSGECDIK
jgi:hypothetical protein